MFNEFLDSYKKRLKLPFTNEEGIEKSIELQIKPLSLNDMMFIIDNEACGYLLLKLMDGIDIEKDPDTVAEGVQKMIINPDYAVLFYAVLACCTYVPAEDGNLISLKHMPTQIANLPFEIQLEILNIVIELSMPKDLKKFSNNVKKIKAKLFQTTE